MKKFIAIIIGFVAIMFGAPNAHASALTTLTDKSNGKSVVFHVGDEFMLSLNSTYWNFENSFNKKIIIQIGLPRTEVIPPGPSAPKGCEHPGSGCGTNSVRFVVKSKGVTYIQAHRDSCGEAIRCTSANSKYKIKLIVK